jgi:hypothetical protein
LQGIQLTLQFSELIALFFDFSIKEIDGVCEFVGLIDIFLVKVHKESIEDGDSKGHRSNSKAEKIQ